MSLCIAQDRKIYAIIVFSSAEKVTSNNYEDVGRLLNMHIEAAGCLSCKWDQFSRFYGQEGVTVLPARVLPEMYSET